MSGYPQVSPPSPLPQVLSQRCSPVKVDPVSLPLHLHCLKVDPIRLPLHLLCPPSFPSVWGEQGTSILLGSSAGPSGLFYTQIIKIATWNSSWHGFLLNHVPAINTVLALCPVYLPKVLLELDCSKEARGEQTTEVAGCL